MRTKKAIINTIVSLVSLVVSVVSAFILPRLIIGTYGSEVNGAISSISQFLGYISLLEAGIGGVTRAALYKPLADNDTKKISGIVNATQRFFRILALIFVAYTIALACGYKYISSNSFDWIFNVVLVLVLAVGTFGQYFFGLSYTFVLTADQKNYVSSLTDAIVTIINILVSVLLITLDFDIIVVKAFSALFLFIKPLFLHIYVKKKYHIDTKVPADNESIKQRWNGLGHHIAYFIHNNTDIFLLTICLGLNYVSVYSVYYTICYGIRKVSTALTGSFAPAYGNMLARGENENLKKRFYQVETFSLCLNVILFACCGALIIDFMKIYTAGVSDINYILPLTGILFSITEYLNAIKEIYGPIPGAAGHFKQTQFGAYFEAILNVVVSLTLVWFLGINGVLIGTIVSCTYRIIYYSWYMKKNIIYYNFRRFFTRQLVSLCLLVGIMLLFYFIPTWEVTSYLTWVVKAIFVFINIATIAIVFYLIFAKKELLGVITSVWSTVKSAFMGKKETKHVK